MTQGVWEFQKRPKQYDVINEHPLIWVNIDTWGNKKEVRKLWVRTPLGILPGFETPGQKGLRTVENLSQAPTPLLQVDQRTPRLMSIKSTTYFKFSFYSNIPFTLQYIISMFYINHLELPIFHPFHFFFSVLFPTLHNLKKTVTRFYDFHHW